MNIELGVINDNVTHDPQRYVLDTNAAYRSDLAAIADDIAANREKRPIILLSGPSGSGKTTTARMIEQMHDSRGIETHTLSLDNWFSPLTDREKSLFAEGKLDLESPNRVDSDFLTQQLTKLLFLTPERSISRKIKEAMTAIRIEQTYLIT